VVSAGGWTATGVDSDRFVRGVLAPLRQLEARRRLIVLNRRPNLPDGMSMGDLAAEYADAIRAQYDEPVDVAGTSTGGSIVQQLAADHPDTVRRLVLISTAYRLSPMGREVQSQVAVLLRAGRTRSAISQVGASLAPTSMRTVARALGWIVAGRVLTDSPAAADFAATLEAEDGFDLSQCKRPIEAKTLIIGGGHDRFYSPDMFTATSTLIPNSHLQLFPRRGHITVASDRRAQATIAGFLTWTEPERTTR
jgi:pimeloyl-ACP methyl ester carboxylesterase